MHAPRRATVEHVRARALTYVLLVVFVVGVYVSVVLGVGAALGVEDDRPNAALSVLATCIVAVALEPLRRSIAPQVRRWVGDTKPTPYEALSRLSRQAAGSYAIDEVAPRIAHVLANGTGAARAEVWLHVGGGLQLAATWPSAAADVPTSTRIRTRDASAEAGALSADPPADAVVPVRHAGDLLGVLVVRKAAHEALTPVEQALVGDLAAQAGLVLRNVTLTRELEARVAAISSRAAELTASRTRLVAAQDDERRRLERDIHDGAQQHLVALVVQLRLVQALLDRAPERAVQQLRVLRERVQKADQTIQDLVRGVYPPTLRERGLVAALREVGSTTPVLVEVSGVDRRYPAEVEAAAYFCCVEAISNAVKHASATAVTVLVRGCPDAVQFSVADDGVGFDPARQPRGSGLTNIAFRLETFGGELDIRSAPGAGTRIEGRLPLAPPERVTAPHKSIVTMGTDTA